MPAVRCGSRDLWPASGTARYSVGVTTPPTDPSRAVPAAPGTSRRPVVPWILWDAGMATVNAVMTTFVFSVYLTGKSFGEPGHTSVVLSVGTACAGVVVAATAPVVGQRADRAGARRRALVLSMCAVVLGTALCFLARPDPAFLWLGVGLLSLTNVFAEISTVHYNALLPAVSTPRTVGRVSGLGWAAGYVGGILALAIVLFGFVTPGLLGLPTEDAVNIRAVALFSAVWTLAFSLPLFVRFPSAAAVPVPAEDRAETVAESYRRLGRTLARLYREEPAVLRFFLASAVFRDGLAGVFAYGGVLAMGTFGFSQGQVVVFAIAGNVVAALGALLGGRLDDRIGPLRVVIGSLAGLLCAAAPLLVLRGQGWFWLFGLCLCAFVGPAQSAARTYLSRLTSPGTEGEYFGLYSTTGRAMSFLAPALFGLFAWLLGAQIWGVLGIMAVLAAGLVLALRLPPAGTPDAADRRQDGERTPSGA